MSPFKTIDDLDVGGKRVLVRVDLNVPVQSGVITDDTRMRRTVPTIQDLQKKGAQVILLSHFGRPGGKRENSMSLELVAKALGGILGEKVLFARDCIGDQAATAIALASNKQVVMLENLRFHPEEEENNIEFAKRISALADVYVNDAFSCAHRAHASTEAITKFLPAVAGRLMQSELEALSKALDSPERPVAAVVGGAKVSTKMDVLGNLMPKVDQLIIGGGMANTFLYANGVNVGRSLFEVDMVDKAKYILRQATAVRCEIKLPIDVTVANKLEAGIEHQVVSIADVPTDSMILDVGPRSVGNLVRCLKKCRTVIWNGPLGAFEISPFDCATNKAAGEAARLTQNHSLISVAGGGDTIAALANAGVLEYFSYVSTAGGAFLEWLEGKTLPAIAPLER